MDKIVDILFFVAALLLVAFLLPVLLEIAFYVTCFIVVTNILHFAYVKLFCGSRKYYEQHTYL